MSGDQPSRGVQVVSVDEGAYRVCGAALRDVTTPSLRTRPVVVVSVAGATRGGKSFLLDFFLRYLRATPSAQCDGTWIGAADEPLDGFSWRGGWQRNTTGILLWSKPIVVMQEHNGTTREVVVLLMDTQGTFDNSSTVRDCTTIFALSTLLSSVQIYNLAQQIKEDDLQHLQLFTEYGKLACAEGDSKPFQSLVFRVRDWMCPFEHSYGAVGGENYLNSILKLDSRSPELRELREHIHNSFESISCFLMPHPGFAVADENFSGRLCDLRQEFIDSLLGFVPSILHPSKLIPKVINGQEIVLGDLITYFNTYVEIFNSDELPTPVNILKATSAACLEAALSAARDAYAAHMERGVERGAARSVPRDAVPRLHAAAKQVARQAFQARRTLAAPAHASERLDRLMQELEDQLATHVGLNEAKTQRAVAEARAAYEREVERVRRGRALCLHPRDVPPVHARALHAAMAGFDARRDAMGVHDTERSDLMRSLEAKLEEATAANCQSNAAARWRASASYTASMRRALLAGAVSAECLQAEHERAQRAALQEFASTRNQPSEHGDCDDHFLNELLMNIKEQFDHLESSNKSSNKAAKQAAIFTYNNYMVRVWGPGACLHPRALRDEHAHALRDALQEYRALAHDTALEKDITQALEQRYDELRDMNNASNDALVTESYAVYTQRMDSKCTPSLASILVVPWLVKVLVMIPKYHEQYRREAVDHFRSKRRGSSDDSSDDYLDRLKRKMEDGFESYRHPLQALAREFGVAT